MYNPKGSDSKREWIEIYNAGNCSVNLSEWRFWESNKEFDQSKNNHRLKLYRGSWILKPGEYAIIASDAKTFADEHPHASCTLIDSSFLLANYGEEIEIKNSTLDVIDSFDYRPYAEKKLAYSNDKTLELKNGKWVESYLEGGTPCDPNTDKVSPQSGKTISGMLTKTVSITEQKESNETETVIQNQTNETKINSTFTEKIKRNENSRETREKASVKREQPKNVSVNKTSESFTNNITGKFLLPTNVTAIAGLISSLTSLAYVIFRFTKH